MMMFLSLLCSHSTYAVPTTLSQQGHLIDALRVPVWGSHNLTFRTFESPSATTAIWTEGLLVFFENGYYQVVLGFRIGH